MQIQMFYFNSASTQKTEFTSEGTLKTTLYLTAFKSYLRLQHSDLKLSLMFFNS